MSRLQALKWLFVPSLRGLEKFQSEAAGKDDVEAFWAGNPNLVNEGSSVPGTIFDSNDLLGLSTGHAFMRLLASRIEMNRPSQQFGKRYQQRAEALACFGGCYPQSLAGHD
jgi:hypothetical protein